MYGVTLTAILLPVLLALFSCSDRGVDPSDVDWPTTSPQEAGLDAQKLSTLSACIKSGVYGEIQSLLVVRHGQLVMEEYYRGTTRYSRYQVYSVTKSVNAILIGIAVSQGRINDLQSNVFAYFPEYADLATNDPLKQQITVEHLLTMTSGLNWDELTLSYNDVKNPVMQMSQNDDWLRFVLDRPMATTPGSKFRYNTGCSLLLGEILHRALGITVDEYARQVLFGPSGIVDWTWSRGSHDIINTGWGLTLRARDMAKIGQLYLQNGVWQNRQIVPSVWVQASVCRTDMATDINGGRCRWTHQ